MMAQPERAPIWIPHGGKRIIFVDYSNLQGQELIDLIKAAREEVLGAIDRGEKGFFSLVDLTDTVAGAEAVSLFREASTVMAGNLAASAVVGITGIKKQLLRFINVMAPMQTKAFDSLEEAKQWIADQ